MGRGRGASGQMARVEHENLYSMELNKSLNCLIIILLCYFASHWYSMSEHDPQSPGI